MTLAQSLSALSTPNVQVKLVDLDTDKEILTFFASGHANLDDTLEARPVKFWSIISTSSIKVVLGAYVGESNTTNDTTTDNTGTDDTQEP